MDKFDHIMTGVQGQSLQSLKNDSEQKMLQRDSDSLINNISSNQKSQKQLQNRLQSPRKLNIPSHKDNGNINKIEQIIEKNKKLMDKYNVITSKQESPRGTKSVNNKMWQSRGGKMAQ